MLARTSTEVATWTTMKHAVNTHSMQITAIRFTLPGAYSVTTPSGFSIRTDGIRLLSLNRYAGLLCRTTGGASIRCDRHQQFAEPVIPPQVLVRRAMEGIPHPLHRTHKKLRRVCFSALHKVQCYSANSRPAAPCRRLAQSWASLVPPHSSLPVGL